jgi:hypothetical protein
VNKFSAGMDRFPQAGELYCLLTLFSAAILDTIAEDEAVSRPKRKAGPEGPAACRVE